jgi:hypothetical protein
MNFTSTEQLTETVDTLARLIDALPKGTVPTSTIDDFQVGDIAYAYSRGTYRRGMVTKVTPTKVTVAYVTQGGVAEGRKHVSVCTYGGHDHGSDWRKAVNVTNKAVSKDQAVTVQRGDQQAEVGTTEAVTTTDDGMCPEQANFYGKYRAAGSRGYEMQCRECGGWGRYVQSTRTLRSHMKGAQ